MTPQLISLGAFRTNASYAGEEALPAPYVCSQELRPGGDQTRPYGARGDEIPSKRMSWARFVR